jgi:hypothetical protein
MAILQACVAQAGPGRKPRFFLTSPLIPLQRRGVENGGVF